MAYTLTHEDDPTPTREQIEMARRADRKRGWFFIFEITLTFLMVIVLPIVLGVLVWHFLPEMSGHVQLDEYVAIFFGVLVCVSSFFWVIYAASEMKGKIIVPEDMQMFHHSENEILSKHWYEIESILKVHSCSIGKVADWVGAYEGKLLYRHLWELRREHVASNFILSVVETCGAQDVRGNDIDMMIYANRIELPQGPADILEGRLLTFLMAEKMLTQTSTPQGAGAKRRL
jgi:hypothetical protein